MALPLNLAMTAAEMSAADRFPARCAWMACHFSPYSEGITNIPNFLPPDSMLILNDRMPCAGHSADLVVQQLSDAIARLSCESLLLDFQQPKTEESAAMVNAIVASLPCPVAVSEGFASNLTCPVFAPPAPLHVPLAEHLVPWKGREVWLEAALCQEVITVTPKGTTFIPQFPPEQLEGGFFDDALLCRYLAEIAEDQVRFILFDTPESLAEKLKKAEDLGVTRAVGLYQEIMNPRFSQHAKPGGSSLFQEIKDSVSSQ